MARILILANSKRPDGQCVAGIDLESGEWVRPVPARGDGIPTNRCFVGGKFVGVRDVVEMDLTRPREIAEFQRENRVIKSWNWTIVGRKSFATRAVCGCKLRNNAVSEHERCQCQQIIRGV